MPCTSSGSGWIIRSSLLAGLAALAFGCRAAEPEITPQMLRAQSPYDLGDDAIDVSAYPEAQRHNYFVFKDRCALCHPLARSVSFPAKTAAEWKPFVEQMNLHSGKVLLGPHEEQDIRDFLVFDAQQRKATPAFEKELARLRALWIRVQAEQKARKLRENG